MAWIYARLLLGMTVVSILTLAVLFATLPPI
jgi:hypothetical protein